MTQSAVAAPLCVSVCNLHVCVCMCVIERETDEVIKKKAVNGVPLSAIC